MRFLFVANRYHTNQIPIMKGLIENGHTVCFVAHYQGKTEDYAYIKPVIGGYSLLFRIINYVYTKILFSRKSKAGDMKLKFGFPSPYRIRKIIKNFHPDVMIIRERSMYSIVTCLACRDLNMKRILYNQSPLWEKDIKKDFAHRFVKSMLPAVRITPVLGEAGSGEKEKGAFFAPFVMETRLSPDQKQWFQDGRVHILCVAKYEKRKNISMLLEILDELQSQYDFILTVAGEVSDHFQREYKDGLTKYINNRHMDRNVNLYENIPYSQMSKLYQATDLFILPSTREPASISQLEAMAYSIPSICSDTNGTSCYISTGIDGYLFHDNNKEDLKKYIILCLSDRAKLRQMGRQAYYKIATDCRFDVYYDIISGCIK